MFERLDQYSNSFVMRQQGTVDFGPPRHGPVLVALGKRLVFFEIASISHNIYVCLCLSIPFFPSIPFLLNIQLSIY